MIDELLKIPEVREIQKRIDNLPLETRRTYIAGLTKGYRSRRDELKAELSKGGRVIMSQSDIKIATGYEQTKVSEMMAMFEPVSPYQKCRGKRYLVGDVARAIMECR